MFSFGGGRSRLTAAVSVLSAACSTLVVRRFVDACAAWQSCRMLKQAVHVMLVHRQLMSVGPRCTLACVRDTTCGHRLMSVDLSSFCNINAVRAYTPIDSLGGSTSTFWPYGPKADHCWLYNNLKSFSYTYSYWLSTVCISVYKYINDELLVVAKLFLSYFV